MFRLPAPAWSARVGRSLGRGGAARHGRPGVCAGGPGASLEPASEQAADRRGQRRPRWAPCAAGQATGTGRPGGGSAASPSAARRRRTAWGSATAPRIRRGPPQRDRPELDRKHPAQELGPGPAARNRRRRRFGLPPEPRGRPSGPVLRGVPEVGPLSSCRAVNAVNTRSDGDRQSVRRGSSGPSVHRAADRQGAAKGGVSR